MSGPRPGRTLPGWARDHDNWPHQSGSVCNTALLVYTVGGIEMGFSLRVAVAIPAAPESTGAAVRNVSRVPQNLWSASPPPPSWRDCPDAMIPGVVTSSSLRRPLGCPLARHSWRNLHGDGPTYVHDPVFTQEWQGLFHLSSRLGADPAAP